MSPCQHDNFLMLLTTNKAKTFKSIRCFFLRKVFEKTLVRLPTPMNN